MVYSGGINFIINVKVDIIVLGIKDFGFTYNREALDI